MPHIAPASPLSPSRSRAPLALQARQKLLQAESLARTRDKEVERLQRLVEAGRDLQQSSGVVADKEASAIKDRASRCGVGGWVGGCSRG